MATNILWCHVEVEHACDALAEQQQALPPDLAQTVADFVRLCRYYIHIGMGQLIPVSTERPAGLALPRHTDIVSAMLAGVSVLTKIATTAHLIRTNDKGALPRAAFEALRQVETLADPFQYVTQGEDPWKNIRQ